MTRRRGNPAAQCEAPLAWPPARVTQAYLAWHQDRMKTVWGCMGVLRQTRHARRPQLPAKRRFGVAGNPMSYVLQDSQYFSRAARRIISGLQARSLPTLDYHTRGVVYAIFFMYTGAADINKIYVGLTHRSVIERFQEHIRKAIKFLQGINLMGGEAVDLYEALAHHGIADCVIVPLPLQQIEGVPAENTPAFYALGKRFERMWVQFLQSLAQSHGSRSGYNRYLPGGRDIRFASFVGGVRGHIMDLWNPIRYLYNNATVALTGKGHQYRNYVRRFAALFHIRNNVGNQSLDTVLPRMWRRNLERVMVIGRLFHISGIGEEEQSCLVSRIQQEVDARAVNNGSRVARTIKKKFIARFLSLR